MRAQKTFFVAGMVLLLGLFIAGVADAAPDMSKFSLTAKMIDASKVKVSSDAIVH